MPQDTISLTVELREVTGKAVKHLRKAGQVPAVIHNHGKESVAVQGDYTALYKTYLQAGKHHPVTITVGDKHFTTLIKTADFDPQKHLLRHIVFNAVNQNQTVDADIPVHPRYDVDNESSPAERSGFIVLTQLESVHVKAIPTKLPDFIEYDAEKLVEIGDHITVADLIVPEGVEIEDDAEHAVATVYEPSALAAANDAAGGDAEAEDAGAVSSDHQSDSQEGTQADEIRPGGKKEFEDKEQGRAPERK